ncbi:hypothetical protein ACFPM1_02560 [Halorubrum rubrum]|uniref:Small CPxCG-related zinc finger protein n=1 Tax=Halorubrum rubrum TaxID=1126240 RepID=A0ABD5QY68_9EURY|nr:hypothetical protein [Halorubrum rubrum]
MTRCIHCGKPSSGRFSLVFERESEQREMDLPLCDQCVDRFEAAPDVRLSE